MNNKVLVTGANGQLGNCIKEIASKYPQFEFIFTDVAELDITDQEAVEKFITELAPQWVINTAAYTDVDKAEDETQRALLLNANAVEFLADATISVGAGLVQISTDYVFRGGNPNFLNENEIPSPISVYGITKFQGEIEAEKNPKHIIIRTSWLYSIYGRNFVKTMIKLGKEKTDLNVVSDQWGNPTSAHDLADVILTAISKPKYGVYHYSNEGATNWAIFAEEIMMLSGSGCVVNHIETKDYPTAAERPMYSLMDKSKIAATFDLTIPEWEYSLEQVVKRLVNVAVVLD